MSLTTNPSGSAEVSRFRSIVENGARNSEIPEIQDIRSKIWRLSEKDAQELNELINLWLRHEKTQQNAEREIRSLRNVMLLDRGMISLESGDSSVEISGELFGDSLASIGVTPTQARALWEKEVGTALTSDSIKTYQASHNIEASKTPDGIIWKLTYSEIKAGEVLKLAQDRIDELWISVGTLTAISEVLKNADPEGTNATLLRMQLRQFHTDHKDDADFEARYGTFYVEFDELETTYENSEAGRVMRATLEDEDAFNEATGERPEPGDGRSFYRRFMDGDIDGDDIKRMTTNPLLLVFVWAMFLFKMWPAKLYSNGYTDSFWKRAIALWWLVWAAKEWSVQDAIGDLFSSETAQSIETGVRSRVETAGNGGRTTVRDAIRWAAAEEWSALNGIFPDAEQLSGLQDKFMEDTTLGHIQISEIPSIIATLEAWDDIPSYLQNIAIWGETISNQQLIALLTGIKEASSWTDYTYIKEALEYEDSSLLEKGAKILDEYWIDHKLVIGGLVVWLSTITIIPTMLWVAVWTAVGGVGMYEMIENYYKENPEAIELITTLSTNITQLKNPELEWAIIDLISSWKNLWEIITELQRYGESFPDHADTIKSIIDSLAASTISWGAAVFESKIDDITSLEGVSWLISAIWDFRDVVNSSVTNADEKTRLLWVISWFETRLQEKRTQIEEKAEESRVSGIEIRISDTEATIRLATANIEAYEWEIAQLETDLWTADAIRLAEIPWEIAAKRTQLEEARATLAQANADLATAQWELAQVEVQSLADDIQTDLNYFNETFAPAVEAQWITNAVRFNIDTLIAKQNSIEENREAILAAPDSPEKTQRLAELTQLESLIEGIKTQYISESAGVSTTLTQGDIVDHDFSTVADISEISWGSNSTEAAKVAEFVWITLQNPEDIKALYKTEIERQLAWKIEAINTADVTNLAALKPLIDAAISSEADYIRLFPQDSYVSQVEVAKEASEERLAASDYETITLPNNTPLKSRVDTYKENLSIEERTMLEAALADNKKLLDLLTVLYAVSQRQNFSPEGKTLTASLYNEIRRDINFLTQ